MTNLNFEDSSSIIMVAEEIMNSGQLWITLNGDEFYLPELISQLKQLQQYDQIND